MLSFIKADPLYDAHVVLGEGEISPFLKMIRNPESPGTVTSTLVLGEAETGGS